MESYHLQKLPIQAQISPIKNSLVDDFNNDGFKDILLVGNHYGVEVETVRYDAGYGSLFLGDGKNNLDLYPHQKAVFTFQKIVEMSHRLKQLIKKISI